MWMLVITALLMGMLVPVQTAANARMRTSVGPAFVVTLVSFAVSSLLLSVVSVFNGIPILPTATQITNVPLWGWTGGIIALFTITVTIYLFRALGQLQTAILPLLGQLLFSLTIDHFGLFGSVRIPLSVMRIFAMLLLISGVLLIVVVPNLGKSKMAQPTTGRHILLWQITGIAAGCLMASIGAIYGRLGICLDSATSIHCVVPDSHRRYYGGLCRQRENTPCAQGFRQRQSVVDVAGRYLWSNFGIRQRMADAANWSRSVLYGTPARTDGAQPSDGR